MPKTACNGFSLFATHSRPKLEAQRGRQFQGGMEELVQACTPIWNELPEEERAKWKEIAREYKKTEAYTERKRAARRQRRDHRPNNTPGTVPTPPISDPPQEPDEDIDSDEDPGVPMFRNPTGDNPVSSHSIRFGKGSKQHFRGNGAGSVRNVERRAMDQKKQEDKEKLMAFFAGLGECGATLLDVKRCRFLLMTMQTYGRLETGVCVPAEMGLVEWCLAVGVMEEYSVLLGPWDIPDQTLRDRAVFNAQQSHLIPLEGLQGCPEFTPPSRRSILKELLGRTEPGLAMSQGVKVGLYHKGLVEHINVPTTDREEVFRDEAEWPQGGEEPMKQDVWPLLPGDAVGRRWVVCLESEYEEIREGIKYLRDMEGVKYEGFPVTPDRFIFLDTLVEALADFVHAQVPEEFKGYLRALESAEETESGAPFEDVDEMYCTFHRREEARTSFCAIALARKAVYTAFMALADAYGITLTPGEIFPAPPSALEYETEENDAL